MLNLSSQAEKRKEEEQNKLGQHSRELNPFWKNGGSGMPPTEEEDIKTKKRQEKLATSITTASRTYSEPAKPAFEGDVKVERNRLTGKLMRAEMKGDKKRIRELTVRFSDICLCDTKLCNSGTARGASRRDRCHHHRQSRQIGTDSTRAQGRH